MKEEDLVFEGEISIEKVVTILDINNIKLAVCKTQSGEISQSYIPANIKDKIKPKQLVITSKIPIENEYKNNKHFITISKSIITILDKKTAKKIRDNFLSWKFESYMRKLLSKPKKVSYIA